MCSFSNVFCAPFATDAPQCFHNICSHLFDEEVGGKPSAAKSPASANHLGSLEVDSASVGTFDTPA